MSIIQAIILGVVQGLTEFLPVSSSGHLLLVEQLFGVTENSMSFGIILHFGTLLPVIFVFWGDIWKLIKKPFQKYTYILILASIPAAIVGFTLEDTIDAVFYGGDLLWITFLITAFILLYSDRASSYGREDKDITYKDALIVGLTQAFAILPGISRSGSTISAGLFSGMSRKSAAKLSFMMSIPVIGGSFLVESLDMIQTGVVLEGVSVAACIAGFLASMITGYLSIKFMLKIIEKAKLKYFAYYLFVIAAITFIAQVL